MTESKLRALLQQGEGTQVEFKAVCIGLNKFANLVHTGEVTRFTPSGLSKITIPIEGETLPCTLGKTEEKETRKGFEETVEELLKLIKNFRIKQG